MAPPPPPPAALKPDKMHEGIQRLTKRIAEIEKFFPVTMASDELAARMKVLVPAVEDVLARVFGNSAEHLRFIGMVEKTRDPLRWKESALHAMYNARNFLAEELEFAPKSAPPSEPSSVPAKTARKSTAANTSVFIVHGRDGPAKVEVARLLERAGLNAVILHEQPNAGRTIIEKFEDHGGSAGFAVVVITADDVGGLDAQNLQPRARQNVIGEMFWFAGKLGRDRVCALKRGDVEMPSDFAGVGYTDMDDRGAWKAELLRELEAAGYAVDWRKALA
jgi:predicted nucleotide-binding protein